MMSLYCNTTSFIIELWSGFFLSAGDIKRIEEVSICATAGMGEDLPDTC